jgi:hypothetical protein
LSLLALRGDLSECAILIVLSPAKTTIYGQEMSSRALCLCILLGAVGCDGGANSQSDSLPNLEVTKVIVCFESSAKIIDFGRVSDQMFVETADKRGSDLVEGVSSVLANRANFTLTV